MSEENAPFNLDPAFQLWQRWESGEQPDVILFAESSQCDSVDQLVEILQVDQTKRWENGEQIQCEDYIDQFPVLEEPEAESELLDLIYSEICLREDSGESPVLDEYLTRFPTLSNDLKQQFQIHCQFGREALSNHLTVSIRPHLLSQASPSKSNFEQKSQPSDFHLPLPQIPGYEVLELLNRGSMGIVYKARQNNLNRLVAIKMILAGAFSSDKDHIRFNQEAEMIANLHHPNIVAVHEIGLLEFGQYFSMDFVDGVTLGSLLDSHEMEHRKAARYLMVIARALDYAHQQGVVHRDLKPANIMIDQKGEPRILDFGLSIKMDSSQKISHSGMIVGTLTHMSPEQARGDRDSVGPASDIYSLGSIFYEMLTGELPFNESSAVVLHQQVITQEPKSLRTIKPSIPKDLDTICGKCLAKEPALRFSSAAELADEVERFLRDEPILSRPISATTRAWRWVRRNPVISGLMTLVVVLLTVGTTVSTYFAFESLNKAEEASKALSNLKIEQKRVVAAQEKVIEESLSARRNLYANQMVLTLQAIEVGDIERAFELLNEQWPKPGQRDLRGFEWYCLWGLLNSELTAFQGHHARVTTVAWSPDGKVIATGGDDASVRLWDAETGRTLAILQGHTSVIKELAFSQDGKLLASTSNDQKIILWNTESGQIISTLWGHSTPVNSVHFSHDQRYLVSGSHQDLKLWDLRKFHEIMTLEGHTDQIRDVCFSPDGNTIVSCSSDRTIRVWDRTTGTENRTLKGHKSVVSSIEFSPDGKKMVSGSWDGTLKLWETSSWEELATLKGHSAHVRCVAFSKDGKTIASGDGSIDAEIILWDVENYTEIARLPARQEMVWGLAFHPSKHYLVSVGGSPRKIAGTSAQSRRKIKLWDITNRKQTYVASAWKGRAIKKWDINTWVWDARISPNSQFIAAGLENNLLRIFDVNTGEIQSELKGHTGRIKTIAVSKDNEYLASGGSDRNILIHHLPTKKTIQKFKSSSIIDALAVSPTMQYVAASDTGYSVTLWNIQSGKKLRSLKGHQRITLSIRFSPDGKRLATANQDGTVIIWDTETGKEVYKITEHEGEVHSVAFSSDGKTIATGGADRSIRIWNLPDGKLIRVLKGHQGVVYSLAFSPVDNKRLVSSSHDWSIRIWDVVTGQKLISWSVELEEPRSLSFSEDGKILTAGVKGFNGQKQGQIYLWREATSDEILQDLSVRAARNWRQTELQIVYVLCCWNLAAKESSPQEKLRLLQQGKEILNRLESDQRLTATQAEWINLFESEIDNMKG